MLIKDKSVTVVVNPNKDIAKLNADVCMLSNGEEGKDLANFGKLFNWPGEYEIKGVPITALQAWTQDKKETLIFFFDVDDVSFCHLGEVGHILTSDMLNEIGDVDILMISCGPGTNLDTKKAMEIIEAIEPRIVIPMGEQATTSLKKEVGAENIEAIDKFVIKSSSELPEDQMKYVILNKSS